MHRIAIFRLCLHKDIKLTSGQKETDFGDKFYGKKKKKKKKKERDRSKVHDLEKRRGKVKSKILRFFGHSNVVDVRRISRERLLTSGEKEKDSNEEFNRKS